MGIYAQRFAADASPQGPELAVSLCHETDQYSPSVAFLGDGGFVVAYHASTEDGRDFDVVARRFERDGGDGAGSDEVRLNAHIPSPQRNVRLAVTPEGVAAVWESYGQDGDGYGVFWRSFGDSLDADAPERMASLGGDGWQLAPVIAAGATGQILVAWYENTPMGSFRIQARVFPPGG